MRRKMQPVFAGLGIDVFEQFGRSLLLVAANSETNDIAITKLNGQVHYLLRSFRSELADCVEDPEQRDAKVFLTAHASAFEALENCCEILFPPQAYSNRNKDLGMQHVL